MEEVMGRFSLILSICAIAICSNLFSASSSERQAKKLVAHVKQSIQNAEKGVSKLSPEILGIEGMSTSKVRHLLNNLCSMPNTQYLEIGCWKGSTWVSALYGNGSSINNATAIDNWSEFGGPEQDFLNNTSYFLNGIKYQYYSVDSFNLDVKKAIPNPVNVYFYDGNHSELAQEMALTYYDSILADEFILIVDDWNWHTVRQGTHNAINKLNYRVVASFDLPARYNGDQENWWNGLYVAVIRKSSP